MTNNDRANEEYRNHQLVSAFHDGKYRGVAWHNGQRVFNAESTSIADALTKLKEWVDQQYSARIISGADSPSVSAYVNAFRQVLPRVNNSQFAMLRAHYHAPEHCLTPTALAEAAGYKDIGGVNLWYGFLGQWLFEIMTTPLDLMLYDDGSPVYTSVLASWIPDPTSDQLNHGHHVWKLHDEVVTAIEEMGLDK
jgi:hypothetical protein